jgi:hypothetical protein
MGQRGKSEQQINGTPSDNEAFIMQEPYDVKICRFLHVKTLC